ncbi:hypothetical protein BDV39DRAFT_198837 [Aspergillus sergii]|uniref:Uncharacterized protein n=1 Tax=Aspergillus sergii TaxID=1034303 RepID=A0A5N6XP75_9EURO|nr:hypothetical protein BDV39DRAFT_198837 [Aspergillus sergii]
MKAVHINLEHESMLYDDSLRELPIRQLCSKLVGLHEFKEHRFRIVPERAGEDLDDVGQTFGSSLVLMHLKDIYERYSDDERYSDERILCFLQKFTEEYRVYLESLSDEKVSELLGVIDDPKFRWMFNELKRRLYLCLIYGTMCVSASDVDVHSGINRDLYLMVEYD